MPNIEKDKFIQDSEKVGTKINAVPVPETEIGVDTTNEFFKDMTKDDIKDWADTCMEFVYNDLGYDEKCVDVINAIEHILSDYKRVLKENEELKEDRDKFKKGDPIHIYTYDHIYKIVENQS